MAKSGPETAAKSIETSSSTTSPSDRPTSQISNPLSQFPDQETDVKDIKKQGKEEAEAEDASPSAKPSLDEHHLHLHPHPSHNAHDALGRLTSHTESVGRHSTSSRYRQRRRPYPSQNSFVGGIYHGHSYNHQTHLGTDLQPHVSNTSVRTFDRHVHLHQLRPGNYRWEFRPLKFLRLCFFGYCQASMLLNLLWPFVPAGIILSFAKPDLHLWVFIVNYVAMAPAANLLSYAGQELAQKLPHVLGVLAESGFGAIVEIVLFTVLLAKGGEESVGIIRHAILGSILANLLLSLGLCFFVGGLGRHEQLFDEAVSEAGTGLMLVAGMGLVVPAIFALGISSATTLEQLSTAALDEKVLRVSRVTSIVLVIAYIAWVYFQTHSHHTIFDDLLRADELRDPDLETRPQSELTMTESLVAITIAIGSVSLISISLVDQIGYLVLDRHLKDSFVGLILIPLVEKAAGHLSAVDEAKDNQMNLALSHVLGASVQTALFNTPYIVFLAWMMGVPMSLNFQPFETAAMILTILVVGNFLRDGRSNYLEGLLLVAVYLMIAVCAFETPNPVNIAH